MTSSRIVAALLIAAALGLGAWWWLGRSPEPVAPVSKPKPGVMTEEERQAYVREHVRAVDLKIGPDLKPGTDEPVPGLLRVTGKVINEGDETIDAVVVVVLPKNEEGEVMAMDQQDVIIDDPFEPGEIREFRFQVRDRPGFSGAFDHELR
jgi:hypothetical protein